MNSKKIGSLELLLLAAIIWGVAFVAQSVGMNYVGPFTFNTVRSLIGGIVLLPIVYIMRKRTPRVQPDASKRGGKRTLLLGGVLCGVCLCLGSNLQQIAIQYTVVGKVSFITALYIILVPVLGIFLRRRVGITVWISIIIAVVGMYFLCITEGFSVNIGDVLTLIGSLCFATHILVIDYFTRRTDGVAMSCIQFFTCGLITAVPMFLFESPSGTAILNAWQPICYAGILSCGVAYTLQIIGQKNVDPTLSSLVLSLESVIGALAGWVLLGQELSLREIFGCILVFCGIILAQLPTDILSKKRLKTGGSKNE